MGHRAPGVVLRCRLGTPDVAGITGKLSALQRADDSVAVARSCRAPYSHSRYYTLEQDHAAAAGPVDARHAVRPLYPIAGVAARPSTPLPERQDKPAIEVRRDRPTSEA